MIRKIVLYYIGVGNMRPDDIEPYMNDIINKTTDKSYWDVQYYLPVRDQQEAKIVFITINDQTGMIHSSEYLQSIDLDEESTNAFLKSIQNFKASVAL